MKSKTHSKNIELNIKTNQYRSIGIDLEFYKKRNPKLKDFIANKKDNKGQVPLSILQEWTIKESAFKAVSNLNSSIKFLNEVIVDFENMTFSYEDLNGFIKLINNDNSFVSISYIK